MIRSSLLLTAVLSIASARATAAPAKLRYAAVFQETLEGKPRNVSATESALVRGLIAKGLTFVDEAQSRKIRSVTDAGKLIDGQAIPEVITTLDADVLIVGKVELVRLPNALLSGKVQRFDALAKVRVIAIDTATVLASIDAHGEGMGYSPEAGGDAAAGAAVEILVPQIVAAGSPRIELAILGIPNISAGEQMFARIQTFSGVKSATVLHAGAGMSKIEIESSSNARELALAIDGADLGLTVTGYSKQAIRAQYDVSRPGRLTLLAPPLQRSGAKAGTWVGRALSEILAESVVSSGLLARSGETAELGSDPKKWRLDNAARTAVLVGSYGDTKDPKVVEVTAKLFAGSGALITSTTGRCPTAELERCGADLGAKLAAQFKGQLEKRTDLFPIGGSVLGYAAARTALSIEKLELKNIFPAQIAGSGKRNIGRLTLKNGSSSPIEDVIASVKLTRFAEIPISIPVGTIAPGASTSVDLELVLDRAVLQAHDENEPAVATVDVEYADGSYRAHVSRNGAVVVYGRSAMSWATPDSIASFVTARDDTIVRLAKDLHSAIPEASRAQPLAIPVALFRGLGSLGLEYAPDPSSPFGADTLDYVSFPSETLASKSGDCDDLGVLYAALAEALGRQALIVSIPGHVFTAVSTGLPAQSAHRLSIEQDSLLAYKGQLFIPLETTKLKSTFDEAWHDAARTLGKWKSHEDQLTLIEVRAAWSRFPATDLAPATGARVELSSALSTSIVDELGKMDVERRASFDHAIEENQKSPIRKATLLAQLERYEEARAVLEGLVGKKAGDFAALNNLGNVQMMMGDVKDARQRYRAALGHTPKEHMVEVRINAAIAAFVVGDENEFADHIVECLDHGGEEAVNSLARGGIAVEGGARGADSQQLRKIDFEAALSRALARRNRALPQRLDRASDASEAQSLGAYLHWLETRARR